MGAVVHCGGEDDVVALGFGDDAFDVFDVERHYLVYTLSYFDAVEVAGVVVLVQENPEAEGDDCTGSKAVCLSLDLVDSQRRVNNGKLHCSA